MLGRQHAAVAGLDRNTKEMEMKMDVERQHSGDGSDMDWLFDIEADPKEEHDVSAGNPEVVARLRQAMQRWEAQHDRPVIP